MPAPDLAREVAFLSDPRNHVFGPRAVKVVETHLSWVFLTDLHAYKLKKLNGANGRLAQREAQCRNEIALNRRLARDTYLGAVALTVNPTGALQLDLGGVPVDWLVWMRRLPEASMLDRAIAARAVPADALRACIVMLARFYRAQPPEPLTGTEWRSRIAQRIEENRAVLLGEASGLPPAQVERLCLAQREFLASRAAMFDRRVADGRIVEGHGDLRPEHLCLEAPPQVIDCLDFSRELRIVDAAEELAFLALECERLGDAGLDADIFTAYRDADGDDPPVELIAFYKSVHACVRARLAVWHLPDPGPAGAAAWAERAKDYLRLAALHAAALPRPFIAA